MHRSWLNLKKINSLIKSTRTITQLFFLFFINYDLPAFFRLIKSKKAVISQLNTKGICFPALNCYSCPSAGYSCPLGSLQFWLNESRENRAFGEKINHIGLYIIGSLLLPAVIFGRFICGFVCPFGFFQDIISKISGRNMHIKRIFRSVKYIILIVFVIWLPLLLVDGFSLGPVFCKYICPTGTLEAGLPLLAFDRGLRESASYITLIKFLILFFVLIMSFFSKRFFCKTMCPLGAFLGLFNRISVFSLEIDKSKCTACAKCSEVCPMGLNVPVEINSSEFIRCMECKNVCSKGAVEVMNPLKKKRKVKKI
jgi:ferredoxin